MHIRKATPEDYDDLCAVFDEVDALHREHLPAIFQKPSGPPRDRIYLTGLMRDRDTALFVAEVENQVVGVIQVFIRDTPKVPLLMPRRFATVEDVVVKSQFRRMGIGRALMQAAAHWATTRGATSIELNVYEFNREAIEFYRSLGYATVSRIMEQEL